MTATTVARAPFARPTVALIVASAAAWMGTVAWAQSSSMGAMPGTMGMSMIRFTAMWALMMAAMMLPSVGPFVGVYQRTVTEQRALRLSALASGYLAVWTAIGVVAFVVAGWFGDLAGESPTRAQFVAVGTFTLVGLYQMSPLKFRCLSHCWALMVLMVAFGVMNLAAMVGLAVVIGIEKVWRYGERFARIVGAGVLVYAVALIFFPQLAPGLDPDAVTPMVEMSM